YIRPVRASDAPAVERICLLTGDAGASAAHLHSPSRQNLLGAVWAVPYVLMPYTFGFVLVDDDDDDSSVKGYVLGATDSDAFARAEEQSWWPALRERYPLQPRADEEPRTKADETYIGIIHRAPDAPHPACLALSPAHLHIDLLPEVQRQGWGRKLIGRAVQELEGMGLRAVWLGMDPRNEDAAKFYERLGFEKIEGAP
ncbi:acyl-CoA N-acyltransferase, partial [Vararia minispora EC-137]